MITLLVVMIILVTPSSDIDNAHDNNHDTYDNNNT